MDIYFICLNILPHIVIYYGPVIRLLNYLICLYTARMSCYKKIIYKFKYLKSLGFRIRDYYFLLIV